MISAVLLIALCSTNDKIETVIVYAVMHIINIDSRGDMTFLLLLLATKIYVMVIAIIINGIKEYRMIEMMIMPIIKRMKSVRDILPIPFRIELNANAHIARAKHNGASFNSTVPEVR